jgi:hypothetical protein
LTFARIQPEGEPERVQLGDLVREVAQLTAPRWRDATQAAGRPISVRSPAGRGRRVGSG